MENRKKVYEDFFAKKESEVEITINDLRDKEFREERLSEEEGLALINFDRFRLAELIRQRPIWISMPVLPASDTCKPGRL